MDQGYTGAGTAWIAEHLGWAVTVVRHAPKPRGEWWPIGYFNDLTTVRFAWVWLPPERSSFRGALPRRWVAERTFARLGQDQRLSKDDGRLCATGEALIYAAMSRLLARPLASRGSSSRPARPAYLHAWRRHGPGAAPSPGARVHSRWARSGWAR